MKAGFTKKVTFEHRYEKTAEVMQVNISGRKLPGTKKRIKAKTGHV
jgi:hypothetical protein